MKETITWSYQSSQTAPLLPSVGSPEPGTALRLIAWAPGAHSTTLPMDAISALQTALEAKDPHLYSHSANVGEYAQLMARMLGLPLERCREVYYSGFFHDLGKIGIADAILHKPGRLSPAERRIMMEHPAIGARILAGIPSMHECMQAALCHQELFDGTGYPRGLAGEEIPLVARIVTIVDTFEAMSTNRIYRKARPLPEILDEIKRLSGRHFDPALTEVFLRLVETPDFQAVLARNRQALPTPAPVPPEPLQPVSGGNERDRWLQRLTLLAESSQRLNRAGDEAAIMAEAGASAQALLNGDASCAWQLRGEILLPHATRGCLANLDELRVCAGDEGLSSYVTYRRMAVAVPDFSQEVRFRDCPRLQQAGIVAALAAPVVLTGQVMGVLTVYFRQIRTFDDADISLLNTLADQVAVALDNARLTQATQRAVNVDPLTGVKNYRSFQELLQRAVQAAAGQQQPLSLLLLDVNHFGDFNEAHGFAIGDEVLRLLAQVIQKHVGSEGTVGRHGGDCFAILLPGHDAIPAQALAAKLQRAILDTEFPRRELAQARVSVAAGTASYPVDGTTPRQLMERAGAQIKARR